MTKQKKIIARPKRLSLAAPVQADYYETDFLKWTEEQSKHLKNRDYSHLDIENLIEEIQSLGKQENSV